MSLPSNLPGLNFQLGEDIDALRDAAGRRDTAEIARRTGKRPKVAVRVNPDFELKTSGMKMAGGPKQFGVDAERVPEWLI